MNEHTTDRKVFRTSQLEQADGEGTNKTDNRTMGEIIAARFSRRNFLRGSLAATAIAATVSPMALMAADEAKAQGAGSRFDFTEVEAGVDATHHVAEGYDADILLRWGDALLSRLAGLRPANQTAESPGRQFGYNNDYVGFIPSMTPPIMATSS
jgi:secreted PhoX family phosphatase